MQGGRYILGACATFVGVTVALQLVVDIAGVIATGGSLLETVERYFSSFTILSNIFAAIALAAVAFDPLKIRHNEIITAITTYLIVVALIYLAEFHGALETRSGVGVLTDAAIHDINPLVMLIVWLSFVARGSLSWRSPFVTLVFPLTYLVFLLVHGALTGIYPYPFLDVSALGYARTGLYATGLLGVYLIIGVIFVLIDRAMGRFCGPIEQPTAEA